MATLYVGADKEYKTILDAVKAASTTEATEIVVSGGDYEAFTFAQSVIGEQKAACRTHGTSYPNRQYGRCTCCSAKPAIH